MELKSYKNVTWLQGRNLTINFESSCDTVDLKWSKLVLSQHIQRNIYEGLVKTEVTLVCNALFKAAYILQL